MGGLQKGSWLTQLGFSSLQGRGGNIKVYVKSSEIQIRTRNPDWSLTYQTQELSYSK